MNSANGWESVPEKRLSFVRDEWSHYVALLRTFIKWFLQVNTLFDFFLDRKSKITYDEAD